MRLVLWLTDNVVRIFGLYLFARGSLWLAEFTMPTFEAPRWALGALMIFVVIALALYALRRWRSDGFWKDLS